MAFKVTEWIDHWQKSIGTGVDIKDAIVEVTGQQQVADDPVKLDIIVAMKGSSIEEFAKSMGDGCVIAMNRAEIIGLKLTPSILMAIACNCENPGKVVLLVTAIRLFWNRMNPFSPDEPTEVDANWFFTVFNILPNDKSLQELWEMQKCTNEKRSSFSSDNWFDRPSLFILHDGKSETIEFIDD